VTEQANFERPCPVCGSTRYSRFADEKIDPCKVTEFTYASRKQPEFMCLRLVRCEECDLVYTPTPPEPSFLSEAYARASFDSGREAIDAAHTYARAMQRHIEKLPHRHAAVDVGAGSGPLLPRLKAMGFDPVTGIEPSRAAIQAAPPEIRSLLKEGIFSSELLSGMRISLVCSFMTLEHISDPAEFVRSVYKLLEPGGLIAIVVHNWRGVVNRTLGLRSPIIDVEHLQLFSPRALETMLSNSGYTGIDIGKITNAYPLSYWLRLSPFPEAMRGWLMGMAKRTSVADINIPLPVGNLLAIGRKP
jgi:SAM-dependent methyltransferase